MLERVLWDILRMMREYKYEYNKLYDFQEKTIMILEDEIHPLICYWILEECDKDYIFEKQEEITEAGKIWLILRRLCQTALSFENWSKYEIKELSFDHFLENYSYPYDPLV
jgi:hypothetical protein